MNKWLNTTIKSEIKTLKTNKSSWPSSIPTKVLKLLKTSVSEPISSIENLYFETNTFPETLKQTNLTSIFKKDDHTPCKNHWPVSLLSNINKIIERLVHKRLSKFSNLNYMLYKKQFEFRHDHSITHALLELTEKIKLANGNEKYSCSVFFDL